MDAPPEPAQSRQRRFASDVALTTGSKLAFAVFGALLTVLVARELGPAGLGSFATLLTLTLLLVQVGNVGLHIGLTEASAQRPADRPRLAASAVAAGFAAGLALALATLAVDALAPGLLPGLSTAELLCGLAAVPLALSLLLLQAVLIGAGRVVAYNLVDIAQASLALAGVFLVFLVFDPGLVAVLAIVLAARVIAVALAIGSLADAAARPDLTLLRELVGRAARAYCAALVAFALIRVDLLLVNALLGPGEAGVYSLAATAAEALVLVPSVVGVNLLPRVALGGGAAATAAVLRSMMLLFGGLCVLSAPAVALAFGLVFGPEYAESTELFWVLLPGVFFLGLLTILTNYYFVPLYPGRLLAAYLAALVLNLALNIVLLPTLGLVAAPLSSTIAYGLVLVAHLRAFSRDAGGGAALIPGRRDLSQLRALARRGQAPTRARRTSASTPRR